MEVKGQYIAYLAKSSEEMASQIAVTGELHVLEYQSYVRGYHAYADNWTPVIGQTLVLKREPTNSHDVHAVAVYYDNNVVGHIPYNLAPKVSALLKRDFNKGFAEITGERVDRGAGYGLEVPGYGLEVPCHGVCTVYMVSSLM